MVKKFFLLCLTAGLIKTFNIVQPVSENQFNNKPHTKMNYDVDGNPDYDLEALKYGVNVDSRAWESRWLNNYELHTELEYQPLGHTEIHIGELFNRKKLNNQYYTVMIFAIKAEPCFNKEYTYEIWKMFRGTVKGTAYSSTFLKSINIRSQLNEETAKIIDSYPKYEEHSVSYTIGRDKSLSSDGLSLGVNASVSYTIDSLFIYNNTRSEEKKFEIMLETQNTTEARVCSSQEKWYYFRFDALTDKKYLHQNVSLDITYEGNYEENERVLADKHGTRKLTSKWSLLFA